MKSEEIQCEAILSSAERSTVMVERKAEFGRQLNPSTYRKLKNWACGQTGRPSRLTVYISWHVTCFGFLFELAASWLRGSSPPFHETCLLYFVLVHCHFRRKYCFRDRPRSPVAEHLTYSVSCTEMIERNGEVVTWVLLGFV